TMNTREPKGPITDTLRDALIASGLSLTALERHTGVTRASIMRFVRGSQSLRLDMADRLAAFLGLELRKAPKRREEDHGQGLQEDGDSAVTAGGRDRRPPGGAAGTLARRPGEAEVGPADDRPGRDRAHPGGVGHVLRTLS